MNNVQNRFLHKTGSFYPLSSDWNKYHICIYICGAGSDKYAYVVGLWGCDCRTIGFGVERLALSAHGFGRATGGGCRIGGGPVLARMAV